jgi:hypothetical protein
MRMAGYRGKYSEIDIDLTGISLNGDISKRRPLLNIGIISYNYNPKGFYFPSTEWGAVHICRGFIFDSKTPERIKYSFFCALLD